MLKPADFEIIHNDKAREVAEAMRPRPDSEDSLISRFIRAGADAEKVARTPVERAAAIAWLNTIYAHTPEGAAESRARLEALETRWRTEHPGEKSPPGCLFGRVKRPLAGLLNSNGEFADSPTTPAAPAPAPSPADFDPLALLPVHLRPGAADPDDDTTGLIPVDLG